MEPPERPAESDCCNSGCTPCILDVYERNLRKFLENSNATAPITSNCLSETSYAVFKLVERSQRSPDTFLYIFEYLRPLNGEFKGGGCVKYNPGQFLLLKASNGVGEFTRAYTPIPVNVNNEISFTIIVRLYSEGAMSNFFQTLQLGGETLWRGPYGNFVINYDYKYLVFIAQGTGVAPFFAVIKEIVNNEDCESFVKLFFCCRNCDDILLREELYELGSFWNFTYEIFLSNFSPSFAKKYNEVVHETRFGIKNLQNYLNVKGGKTQVLICGNEKFSDCMKSYAVNCGLGGEDIVLF